MKAVDLFAGAGGLSLGFKQAGFEIIAAYDCWEEAVITYQNNFPDHRVKKIDLKEMLDLDHPEIHFLREAKPDLIMGGPPCQDFSQAGKRNGNGRRGDLTPIFAKIVALIKPEWVVMENVNTIVSVGKEQLAICLDTLRTVGYRLTIKTLNAMNFGVPQNRKRLFVIGRLNGKDEEMSKILDLRVKPPICVGEYCPTIATGEASVKYYYRHPRTYGRRAIFSIDEVSPTIRGVNRPMPETYRFHEGDRVKDRTMVRPLSYNERALIQSFPPDYIWTGNKSDKEQLIGNAVPPKLARVIGETILEFESIGLKKYM